MATTPSPNFEFLKSVDPVIVELAVYAEKYVFTDPNSALVKTRQIGELIVKEIFAKLGRSIEQGGKQVDLVNELWRMKIVPSKISQMMHEIRKKGNQAVHEINGERGEALYHLKVARKIAVWYYKTFKDRNFKSGPFVPPPPPVDASEHLKAELEELRRQYLESESKREKLAEKALNESELRLLAEEDARRAYEELDTAIQLGEEDNARLVAKIAEFEALLAAQTESAAPTPEEIAQTSSWALAVEDEVVTESDTRELIDRQLRAAGWLVDSVAIRHSKGSRPQKNKYIAVAEWPTASGPADYVLFIGLMPVAIVEAKKQIIDIPGALDQAKRYSKTITIDDPLVPPSDQPWQGKFHIPFMFSANGRPYLKQMETKSGIWFYDGRRSENISRALVSWYSPLGLKHLLKLDLNQAEENLSFSPSDYLPLRYYQRDAIKAVEKGILEGRREMLVAMATGTGKTRTCICLCYRLLKAGRFRRVLFLVDRTSLGLQATDSFKDLQLENNQTFPEIYDVKELGDLKPDADTKLQVATIQGLVQRILFSDDPIPIDSYDCIVVDECHRGYNLDQEMSDGELKYRDEKDYISKYMRVLEYFDAVKIGLTATPAQHTLSLFGGPARRAIYQYSYRKAVIDDYLVDHLPPFQVVTEKSQDGITFKKGEDLTLLNSRTNEVKLTKAEDDVSFDVTEFNRKVITQPFNQAVCEGLSHWIDPTKPGKTLVYCVTDDHADMVVTEFKKAFKNRGYEITDDTVKKITGSIDDPNGWIRHFKNEQTPNVVVTVDLLTTGIDVPEITNLVFLRRVRSRILYEQMLGRATRKCLDLYGEGRSKGPFRVFDAVKLYEGLLPHTSMKPVVARPSIGLDQMIDELKTIKDDSFLEEVRVQVLGRISRKLSRANESQQKQVEYRTQAKFVQLSNLLSQMKPVELGKWLDERTTFVSYLEEQPFGDDPTVPIDLQPDKVIEISPGYGDAKKPEDYLESFKKYVEENLDSVVALQLVTQRPRDLTRQQLKDLKAKLDADGFRELMLFTAYKSTTNQDIAASIIGLIRHLMLDTPLVEFERRVDLAMEKIRSEYQWNPEQLKWLDRFESQIRLETIVDRESLNEGQFMTRGGFDRINKIFDGKLEDILGRIAESIWSTAA